MPFSSFFFVTTNSTVFFVFPVFYLNIIDLHPCSGFFLIRKERFRDYWWPIQPYILELQVVPQCIQVALRCPGHIYCAFFPPHYLFSVSFLGCLYSLRHATPLYCSTWYLYLFVVIVLMTTVWVPNPQLFSLLSRRFGVSVLSSCEPIFDYLMITYRTAITLRELDIRCHSQCYPQTFLPIPWVLVDWTLCRCSSWKLFYHKQTVESKINSFSIECLLALALLGVSLLVSLPSFWSMRRGEMLLPGSSWEVLLQWAYILPSPAMSWCTSQLTHSVVRSLVWYSFSFRMPASKQYLELIWEKLLLIVLSQLLGRPHTEKYFLQTGQFFTLCFEQVHK